MHVKRAYVITNLDELQALLDACSSAQEWEMLTESVLIPEEWIPMAHARLLELTAEAITKFFRACSVYIKHFSQDWLGFQVENAKVTKIGLL